MAATVPTNHSSSRYVSPILGPTNPWGQETSTGTFRPPYPPSPSLQHETNGIATEEVNAFRSPSLQRTPYLTFMDHSQSHLQLTPQNSGYPIERIMNMIITAVGQERDTFAAQKESNRVLEQELKQVQKRREESQRTLREVEILCTSLEELKAEQLELLRELKNQ